MVYVNGNWIDKPRSSKIKLGSDLDVKIGNFIKLRRIELGLSQVKVATGIAVTWQQLQKYEDATNRVSIERFIDLGRVLGFDPFDALRDLDTSDKMATPPKLTLNSIDAKIVGILSRIDSHADKKQVLSLARHFAKMAEDE